jgi:hypothetical protein
MTDRFVLGLIFFANLNLFLLIEGVIRKVIVFLLILRLRYIFAQNLFYSVMAIRDYSHQGISRLSNSDIY